MTLRTFLLGLVLAVLAIDYGSRLISLSSATTELEGKVVGKTPDGLHRWHFQEWLDNCYPAPKESWCGTAYEQPSILREYPND